VAKLFFKIVLFLLALAIVIRIPGCFDNSSSKDPNVARLSLAEIDQFKNVDILVLGNSHAYSGINPKIFNDNGISMLNYATAAAGPYAIKLTYDDYVARSGTKPKSVLINLSPAMFCDASDVFEQYPIHRYLKEPLSNEEMLRKGYVSVKQYFKLTTKSFTQGMKKLFITETPDEKMTKSLLENAGYVPREGLFNDSVFKANEQLYKATLGKQEFDENKSNFLCNFFKQLEKDKVKIFMQNIPSNKYDLFFSDDLMKEFVLLEKKLVGIQWTHSYRGAAHDYRIGEWCFADMDHLNTVGARKYSEYLYGIIGGEFDEKQ